MDTTAVIFLAIEAAILFSSIGIFFTKISTTLRAVENKIDEVQRVRHETVDSLRTDIAVLMDRSERLDRKINGHGGRKDS